MWTSYKELQNLVERYITSSSTTHDLHEFTETLRNHRQNFLTLLENPVSNYIKPNIYNIKYEIIKIKIL